MLSRPTISRCSTRPASTRTVAFVEALERRRLFAASPLTPSILSDTLPASVIAGASSKAVVKVNVVNSSGVASSGHGNISLFADSGNHAGFLGDAARQGKREFLHSFGEIQALQHSHQIDSESFGRRLSRHRRVDRCPGKCFQRLLSQTLTVAAPFVSISAAFQPLTSTSPSAAATIVLTNNGNETANLLADSYDENFATDPTGLNTVGTTEAGFFLGIARSLKAGASFKLRLSFYKYITAPSGMYYLAFQLVGDGGATLLTAGRNPGNGGISERGVSGHQPSATHENAQREGSNSSAIERLSHPVPSSYQLRDIAARPLLFSTS